MQINLVHNRLKNQTGFEWQIFRALTQRNLNVHSIPLNVHANAVPRMYAVMMKHAHLTLGYCDLGGGGQLIWNDIDLNTRARWWSLMDTGVVSPEGQAQAA